MGEKILTVPKEITGEKKYLVTGNEWLALPTVDELDGTLKSVNCSHFASKSLIEVNGGDKPLLKPGLKVNDSEIDFVAAKLDWQLNENWIPQFNGQTGDGEIAFGGTILAPVGHKGFVYQLWCENRGKSPVKTELFLEGNWKSSDQLIYNRHPLNCYNRLFLNNWVNCLVMEVRPDSGWLALGLYIDQGFNILEWREKSTINPGLVGNSKEGHRFVLGKSGELVPGEKLTVELVVGANSEADGAAVTAVDLKRRGYEVLYEETVQWLNKRQLKLNANSKNLESLLNRNLLFNYFYTTGNTLDTGDVILLTSRSPRYYVSGAFWARDAFLWSFPALILTDKRRAREVLETGFSRYAKNGPFHSCYLNGEILYPGFELDQVAAFFIALDNYLDEADDVKLTEDWLVDGARYLEEALWEHHDQQLFLFSTFLDPSDDQVKYPFLTYDNVLAWRAIMVLQKIYRAKNNTAKVRHLDGAARLLKKAIQQHCVVKGPTGSMYAWAVDGKGEYQLYDNPPGSLLLLPHYGFCSNKDKTFVNTAAWIYSHHNKYAYLDGKAKGLGGVHAQHPWVLSVCNGLLAGREREGVEFLSQAHLDNGYACETVDQHTGELKTGAHMAPSGGFLAYSLYHVFGYKK